MKKHKRDLSIVISNFNTKDLLRKTIGSIIDTVKDINYEIIVVDDFSKDGSSEIIEQFPSNIKVIRNKVNLGYSKSYNIGTKASEGKYILHLNSDVILLKNSFLNLMIDYMNKNKEVGLIGCKILKWNGNLDLPCKRSFPTLKNIFFQTTGLAKLFPNNGIFGEYYLTYLNENKMAEVDCLMGAFMLIRRRVIEEIGLLDERFFIYGEDIDYCYRAKKSGWKIVYFPKVKIKHLHGGTTRNFKWKHIWRFHEAMFSYYNKHHFRNNSIFLNFSVYIGIILRFLMILSFEYSKNVKRNLISKIL